MRYSIFHSIWIIRNEGSEVGLEIDAKLAVSSLAEVSDLAFKKCEGWGRLRVRFP